MGPAPRRHAALAALLLAPPSPWLRPPGTPGWCALGLRPIQPLQPTKAPDQGPGPLSGQGRHGPPGPGDGDRLGGRPPLALPGPAAAVGLPLRRLPGRGRRTRAPGPGAEPG